MKKAVLTVVLLTLMTGLSGCIVSIKGDDCASIKKIRQLKNDSTIAEIDAVATLSSGSAKLKVLKSIAMRPELSPEARVHLIKSLSDLPSGSAREEVLMILAENPPMVLPMDPCDERNR